MRPLLSPPAFEASTRRGLGGSLAQLPRPISRRLTMHFAYTLACSVALISPRTRNAPPGGSSPVLHGQAHRHVVRAVHDVRAVEVVPRIDFEPVAQLGLIE